MQKSKKYPVLVQIKLLPLEGTTLLEFIIYFVVRLFDLCPSP